MIHVLTHDKGVRSELAEFLEEIGHECVFHESPEPLVKAVRKLNKSDFVFYDLQLEDILWAFEQLYTACKRTNLVAFERMTKQTDVENNQCPAGVENYLLLPRNPERAKERVRKVLREILQRAASRKKAQKKKAASKARKKVSKAKSEERSKAVEVSGESSGMSNSVVLAIARYLQTNSPAMRQLMVDITAAQDSDVHLVLEGEEGAEFEMLAREINFQQNGDARPLHLIDPMDLKPGELTQLLSEVTERGSQREYLYLGQTADWLDRIADEIEEFFELYQASKDPPLQLIIAYSEGSEAYTSERVRTLVRRMRRKGRVLRLPGMGERKEDIPMIAHTVFATLRMAHPFLRTRVLSAGAVEYLQSECLTMDYCRLARIIRNSMALSKGDTISRESIISFSDDSPITQHLLESMADECYFKTGGE
jgi:DNA-binding NtrC family response regulator